MNGFDNDYSPVWRVTRKVLWVVGLWLIGRGLLRWEFVQTALATALPPTLTIGGASLDIGSTLQFVAHPVQTFGQGYQEWIDSILSQFP